MNVPARIIRSVPMLTLPVDEAAVGVRAFVLMREQYEWVEQRVDYLGGKVAGQELPQTSINPRRSA